MAIPNLFEVEHPSLFDVIALEKPLKGKKRGCLLYGIFFFLNFQIQLILEIRASL